MAQNREIDDLPTATATATATTAAAAPSGCGSIGPGHGPDTSRMEREEVNTGGPPAVAVAVQVMRSGGDVISLVSTTTEERKREAGSAKRAVNRCSGCRKRVGLTGFRCRCGDLFCSVHRYSDRHDCSYDYKAAGRAAIARENPVVRAAKILKL